MALSDTVSSLDMHIIAEELADLRPHMNIGPHAPDVIEYHSPLIGQQCADAECVYVVSADQLASLVPGDYTGRTCFVCAGRPPAAVLSSPCSIIWVEDISLPELVIRMTGAFKRYMRWERDATRALVAKNPPRTVAEITLPLFAHPVCVWDLHFQTIFHGADERAPIPEGYRWQAPDSVWDIALMDAYVAAMGKRSREKVKGARRPFVVPSIFSDRPGAKMLCMDVFIDDVRAATICVDDIEGAPSDADFSKVTRAAIVLAHALEAGTRLNTSIPGVIDECIHKVLEGDATGNFGYAGTEIFGWSRTDPYRVIAVHVEKEGYPDGLLRAVAEDACMGASDLVYTVFHHKLLFIANEAKGALCAEERGRGIEAALTHAGLSASVGVSDRWVGLGNLPLAFRQAVLADEHAGKVRASCVAFRDVLLPLMLDRLASEGEQIELFLPEGLRRLYKMDGRSAGSLADVLRAYLDCNCSITATSRALFMHRNTLSYKMEKIKETLHSQLDDPEERLALSIALRMKS